MATATSSKKTDFARRIRNAQAFAINAARLAANTHCQNVVVLDVRNLSPVTDFFVLATGTSARQMRTVCDEIQELGATQEMSAIDCDGYEGETWILVDLVDVIVHVFDNASRQFYDLDNLWGDAVLVDWTPPPPKRKRAPRKKK